MPASNDDQTGSGKSPEADVVSDSQFDQTIGDDGAVRDESEEQTIVDETVAPAVGKESQPDSAESFDATIVDDSVAAIPDTSNVDSTEQTLMDPSLGDGSPEPAGSERTIATDGAEAATDATITDMTVATGVDADVQDDRTVALPDAGDSEQSGESAQSDATILDDSIADASSAAADQDAATLMDPSLGGPLPDGHEATVADPDLMQDDRSGDSPEATIVQPGSDDAEATLVDPSVVGADDDATMLDTTASATGDATEGTVLETELNTFGSGESSYGQTAASAASGSGPGNWNQTKGAGAARKKSAHETADRWESQQRYSLVNNFARGGLGQIWLASDTRLRREVAYKEMLPTALKNKNALERFLEEAQITGQLEHPGIVPIYDIGYQQNGAPFYSMKLVRGETMEKEIEQMHELPAGSPERSLAFRKLLGSFVSVCNAMAFAHDRGVLHRDLKPLNVMLGAFGEALVLDWGLAKIIDVDAPDVEDVGQSLSADASIDGETVMETSDGSNPSQGPTHVTGVSQPGSTDGASAGGSMQQSQGENSVLGPKKSVVTDVRSMGSQTMMGSVMGTPSYMPPEQAQGKIDQLDARSDIYSLGGILYKLLTNEQPIPRGKIRDVLQKVINNEIVAPCEHDPDIPKPLEAICMKAMAKETDGRYSSALDLAADVEAWLGDEEVSCFEDPWPVRARRWMRRHPKLVTGVASTAAVLFVTGTLYFAVRTHNLNQIRGFAASQMQRAESSVSEGDFEQARGLITEAIGRTGEDAALAELRSSLSDRLSVIETQRLQSLRRKVETELAKTDSLIDDGEYQDARTSLAELTTLLEGETGLPDLSRAVLVSTETVDRAIELSDVIAETSANFEAFLVKADHARAYGSLQEMENIDDDAKQANASIEAALDLFGLNTDAPFAADPQHFGRDLVWTRRYFQQNATWPLEELKDAVFELLLIRAEMESRLARNAAPDEQKQAAKRSLQWIAMAETINPTSQALLGWKAAWLAQAGEDNAEVLLQAGQTQASSAIDYYMLAEIDRKRGLFDRALERYLKAQQLDPDNYWIQHFTGLCYLNQGQTRAALATFSNCISLRPNYAWPRMLRGLCFGQLGKTDESLADFDAALKLDEDLAAVYVNRGAVLLAQSKFDQAADNFATAAKLTPLSAKPLINLALTHSAKAEAISEGAEDGPFAELEAVERQQLEQTELEAALDALKNAAAAERAPFHPGVHQLRAEIFDRQGQTTAALESLNEHIRLELKPVRKAESYKLKGYIHFRDGNQPGYEAAKAAFQQAETLVPDDPETTGMIAETHLRLSEFSEALSKFRQYIDLVNAEFRDHVNSPNVLLTGMATALDGLGEKREAVELYTLSVLLDEQVTPLTRRAWALLLYNVSIAIQDFQAARAFEQKIGNANPDTLIGLAYAWTQAGNLDAPILDTLKTDETEDTPVPLSRATAILEEAFLPARGQAAQLAQRGQIVPGCILFHNMATAYAQCVRLFDEKGSEEVKREELVGLACARIVECINHAIKDPDRRALNIVVQKLLPDSSFEPLYGEAQFNAIFQQLGLTPPRRDTSPETTDPAVSSR